MPYAFSIFPDRNLVLVEASGRVQGADVLDASEHMFSHPDWHPTINQLCDFRQVTGVAVTLDDMEALMALERRFDERIGPGKQALVVSNELHEMLCRLYVAMARLRQRPQTIRVFRKLDKATAWLEEPPK